MKLPLNMKIALSIFLTMIISVSCFGQNGKDIVLGRKYSMYSEILKKDRQYWVHIPKSYNDTIYSPKKYPLLVILDAEEHFELASSIIKFMSTRLDSKLIPEFIVVGVSGTDRIHYYTPTHSIYNPEGVEVKAFGTSGGGPQFLEFLQRELISQIDKEYRTQPYRILAGHSLGGTLAVYDYFSEVTLFNSYIAMDPSLWWDNELLVEKAKSANLSSLTKENRRLFISSADNSPLEIDTTPMRKSQDAFYVAMEANFNIENSLYFKFQYFESEDHGTVVLPSLYQGMQFIFQDYRMKNLLGASAEEIRAYFENTSNRIGIQLLPSERVINVIGNYLLLDIKQVNNAISLFELNVSNYPKSYHAYYSLAEALKQKGEEIRACEYYKKSLVLKPSNEVARKALEDISGNN